MKNIVFRAIIYWFPGPPSVAEMTDIPEYYIWVPVIKSKNSWLSESQIFLKNLWFRTTTIFILNYWLRYSRIPGISDIARSIVYKLTISISKLAFRLWKRFPKTYTIHTHRKKQRVVEVRLLKNRLKFKPIMGDALNADKGLST